MSSRLYDTINHMHKEASFLSSVGKVVAANPAGAIGAGIGGMYGAAKGSQGADGGMKGALVGGLEGAAGGALIGGMGHKMYRGLRGTADTPGIFKQLKQSKKKLNTEAGVTDDMGFFARRKQINSTVGTPEKLEEYAFKKNNIDELAQSGHITAEEGRRRFDKLVSENPLLQHKANKDKLIYGGIGGAYALYEGQKLLGEAASAGKGITDQQRIGNLQSEYQRTGTLDPRQLNMLSRQLQKNKAV
jgi:hypothetical protein